jgi:hypothetical protein
MLGLCLPIKVFPEAAKRGRPTLPVQPVHSYGNLRD